MSPEPLRTTKRTTKEPPERARAKKATAVPDAFVPTDEQVWWAMTEVGLDRPEVATETAKFLDYHRAKGSTMKDWAAAWRNWMRNSVTFRKPSNGNGRASPAKLTPFEETQAAIDEVFGRINGAHDETGDFVFETTGKVTR